MNIIIALENIRSLYNVGAIYRTAEFFGIQKILLIGYTGLDEREPSKIHKRLTKTSLGTINKIETERYQNMNDAKSRYPMYKIVAVEQDARSIPITQFALNKKQEEKVLLVFGNEVDGIQKETLRNANTIVEVPRLGTHQSLNVATTAGIILAYLQLGTSTNPTNNT